MQVNARAPRRSYCRCKIGARETDIPQKNPLLGPFGFYFCENVQNAHM